MHYWRLWVLEGSQREPLYCWCFHQQPCTSWCSIDLSGFWPKAWGVQPFMQPKQIQLSSLIQGLKPPGYWRILYCGCIFYCWCFHQQRCTSWCSIDLSGFWPKAWEIQPFLLPKQIQLSSLIQGLKPPGYWRIRYYIYCWCFHLQPYVHHNALLTSLGFGGKPGGFNPFRCQNKSINMLITQGLKPPGYWRIRNGEKAVWLPWQKGSH